MGNAMTLSTSLTMVGMYFEKRRGFANTIAVAGGSAGGLVFAPLLTVLFQEYGYQGLLVMAGIALNGCVSAALFRPPEFYTKPVSNPSSEDESSTKLSLNKPLISYDENGDVKTSLESDVDDISQLKHNILKSPMILKTQLETKRIRSYSECQPEVTNDNRTDSPASIAKGNRRRTVSENRGIAPIVIQTHQLSLRSESMYLSADCMGGSSLNIPSVVYTYEDDVSEDIGESKASKLSILATAGKALANVFDLLLLKMPLFYLYECAAVLICPGVFLSTLFIAPLAKECDLTAGQVGMLVTVYSAVDLGSRILIALISDNMPIKRTTFVSMATLVIGVSAHFLRYFSSYTALMIYSVVLGLFSGPYFSLYAVIIVDLMTLEKLQSVLGFTSLFHGGAVGVMFYVVGKKV